MRKDFAASLSLANLCYMAWWKYLIIEANHYYWKQPPDATAYIAIMANVLVLTLLFLGVIRLARRYGGERWLNAGRVLFLVATIVVLNHARLGFFITTAALTRWVGAPAAVILLLVVAALAILIAVRWPARVLHGQPVLVLLPFVLVTFGNALVQMVRGGREEELPLAAPFGANAITFPRIVWVVFDEFDYRLAFSATERAVAMPELDRLRAEALDASNAFPPAEHTRESMVALITGRLVEKGDPVDSDEFAIQFAGASGKASWSAAPTVFSDAREHRRNTALAGWFHPYCRVLAQSLTSCRWEPLNAPYVRAALVPTMLGQARALPTLMPFSRLVYRDPHTQPDDTSIRGAHLGAYGGIMASAQAAARDASLGLVLVHFPVPHSPYVYNRYSRDFAARAGPVYFPTYLDNLALADFTFGSLRRSMESAGVWDQTTVLVTSDHSLRGAQQLYGRRDERVPFVLKISGQREGLVLDTPFNTVTTRGLFAAIADGSVSTHAEAAQWLSAHAMREPPTRIRR